MPGSRVRVPPFPPEIQTKTRKYVVHEAARHGTQQHNLAQLMCQICAEPGRVEWLGGCTVVGSCHRLRPRSTDAGAIAATVALRRGGGQIRGTDCGGFYKEGSNQCAVVDAGQRRQGAQGT